MKQVQIYNQRIQKGFTVLEALMAVLVIGFVASSIMVVMDNSISSLTEIKLRTQAFELARENMEMMLTGDSVTEISDSGTSDINPEIAWEISIKAQQASSTDGVIWVKAKSSASYRDSNDDLETIEFEQWITSLTKSQSKQIQKLRMLQAQEDGVDSEIDNDETIDSELDNDNKPQLSDEDMWKIVMDYLNGKITYQELIKRLGW